MMITTINLLLEDAESLLAGKMPEGVRVQLESAVDYLSQDWVRADRERYERVTTRRQEIRCRVCAIVAASGDNYKTYGEVQVSCRCDVCNRPLDLGEVAAAISWGLPYQIGWEREFLR